MYPDPKRVRRPYARINLDEYEARLIDALVDYTGQERAALLRDMVLREALSVLGVDDRHSATLPNRTS